MKKFLPVIIFFMITFNSYAQNNWVYVTSNFNEDDFFVDRVSFQILGDSVTFWQRVNYKQRQESGDLSVKAQKTINCRTREAITRYILTYDDINNNGRITGSFKPQNSAWEPIPPDTVIWTVYKFVCK